MRRDTGSIRKYFCDFSTCIYCTLVVTGGILMRAVWKGYRYNMKTITIFTAFPKGKEGNDFSDMEKFTAELNRFYEKFNLRVELVDYDGTMPVNEKGQYSVAGTRGTLLGYVRKSMLCCIIVFCKKEELNDADMGKLIRELVSLKKAEVAVYFKPNDNMLPVRNDIMRRIAAIDEKTIIPREDRKHLSEMAKNFLNYGCACDRENKLKEAEAAYTESLIIQQKLVKADENTYLQDLALPYHNLGILYYRTNRHPEAERMYKLAIESRRKLAEKKGDEYLAFLAVTANNLGALYVQDKKYEEAEKTYLEVLEVRRKLAGDDDKSQMSVADICGNLGTLYNRLERTEDAEKMFKESLDIHSAILEKYEAEQTDAPQTIENLRKKAASTSNSLGIISLRLKKEEEAVAYYKQAIEIYEKLAKENPDEYEPSIAMVCYNLFNAYRSQKNSAEALIYYRRTTQICEARKDTNAMCRQLAQTLNADRINAVKQQAETAAKVMEQARNQQESGLFEEAIRTYQQAAKMYQALPGLDHMAQAALVYNEMGLLYWDTLKTEDAERCYKTSLQIYEQMAAKDEKHLPGVAIANYNLGLFYQEIRDEDVNEYLRAAFEIAGKCLDSSEQCREIYENLEDEPLYDGMTAKERETSVDTDLKADLETDMDLSEQDNSAVKEDSNVRTESLDEAQEEQKVSSDNDIETETASPAEQWISQNAEKKTSGGWLKKLFGKK